MVMDNDAENEKPGFWMKLLVVFPIKWGVGTISLWLLEEIGFFNTFGIDQLGISHLTWAQRAGIALLITP